MTQLAEMKRLCVLMDRGVSPEELLAEKVAEARLLRELVREMATVKIYQDWPGGGLIQQCPFCRMCAGYGRSELLWPPKPGCSPDGDHLRDCLLLRAEVQEILEEE